MDENREQEVGQEKTFDGIVRPLQEEDVLHLRPILEEWVRYEGRIIESEVEEDLDLARKSLTGENECRFFVAETKEGKIIGMMGLRPPDERLLSFAETSNPIELITAYVASEHRGGKRVGSALIEALRESAKSKGSTEIVVNSGPRYEPTGWGFYDRTGFTRAGVARDMYGEGIDAQVWRKPI
jgi:ribosomal protein S18 acetylase RimI-like enzyme